MREKIPGGLTKLVIGRANGSVHNRQKLPKEPIKAEIKAPADKEGDLRIWWIPQVPGKAFKVPVKDIEQAKLLYEVLADYDRFQYDNNIKPDYANTGGLEVFEDGEWYEWHDPDGDLDIAELMRM